MRIRFKDRRDAGRRLGARLAQSPSLLSGPRIVLGLPRGGVPVAAEVATALGAPLDIWLVRKLGTPGQEELAMGAIASGGVQVLNTALIRDLEIRPEAIAKEVARETRELHRRETLYRKNRAPLNPSGQTVVLVDDGIATGSTLLAGVQALRHLNPASIQVAVPVAPPSAIRRLATEADEVVCLHVVEDLVAVGYWYEDFRQTSDEEVQSCLAPVPE